MTQSVPLYCINPCKVNISDLNESQFAVSFGWYSEYPHKYEDYEDMKTKLQPNYLYKLF